MTSVFNDQSILITGGTGAFGQKFLQYVKSKQPRVVRLLSRDEMKHAALKRSPSVKDFAGLQFRIGDICRKDDLEAAMRGVDVVIHAAAMKHLPECEANPGASTIINVDGTRNVIDAFLRSGARSLIFLSTDKAPYASSIYGAQKYLGEKLLTEAALNYPDKQIFALRYSNVIDSTGSVFHIFGQMFRDGKTATVNGSQTFRGFVTQQHALSTIESALTFAKGGEVFVLNPRVIRISELAQVMQQIVGRGQVEVKETLGAGWEKESATLVMAEEAGFASSMPGQNAGTVMLDFLKRHLDAKPISFGESRTFTLDDCETLQGELLKEFLTAVMRDNQYI